MTLLFTAQCDTATGRHHSVIDATIAIDCTFLTISLAQLALSVLVLTRRLAYRPAFIALTWALVLTVFRIIFDIASVITCAGRKPLDAADIDPFGDVQDMAGDLAEILSMSTAFLILRSRRVCLESLRPETKEGGLKPGVDAVLLAFAAVAVVFNHIFILFSGFLLVQIAYLAVTCLVILYLIISAWYLRARISRFVHHDQPTDSVACLLAPLWAVGIFAKTLALDSGGYSSTWAIALINKGMLPTMAFSVLLSLGLSRSAWEFNDREY